MHRTFNPILASIALTLMFAISSPAAYRETDVSNGGSIRGTVSFRGALPKDAVEKIDIVKDMDTCGEGKREVVWVDVKEGALRGTFVFIEGIEEGKRWAGEGAGKAFLDQKGCRFIPSMQIIRQGTMTIRNSDKGVLHNVNMREMIGVEKGRVLKRSLFNIAQPETGEIAQEVAPKRSPYLSITCEIHNFMFGHALVTEHPYAVIVDEKGNFEIGAIPPGTYTMKAWHPRLGVKESKIIVETGKPVRADFQFEGDK